jgi:hypothetical protein
MSIYFKSNNNLYHENKNIQWRNICLRLPLSLEAHGPGATARPWLNGFTRSHKSPGVDFLLVLKRCRESLARLREHPKVALTIFAAGNLAFTARGPARVVQEPMPGAPMFAAVAIDVENIDDHRQRDLVVDSGVSLDWTNERTQRFVQEHLNALREVAASEE